MLFLSEAEAQQWRELGAGAEAGDLAPGEADGEIRSNLLSAFHCYVGTLLAAKGQEAAGKVWFREGMPYEEDGLFLNAFVAAFLERQGGFIMPEVCFADPRPYVHFTTVPIMKNARAVFLRQAAHSLPDIEKPLRIVDLGTGNGALVAALLKKLQEEGKVKDIERITLVDASPAMVELADKTVRADFPDATIEPLNLSIQDYIARMDSRFDLALSSLAYHHMPWEAKMTYMKQLRPWIDHFLLFEVNANNDTPELHTPELAVSVYQSYGRLIDYVFSHDAPIDVAQSCVDSFLMTEAVSLFTQPRGVRTEYHMLRGQWRALLDEGLGAEFTCHGDSTSSGEEYMDLYTLHYGRA